MGKRLAERIAHERELRRLAQRYERRLSDQVFHEIRALSANHVQFHDREHQLYDQSVALARESIEANLRLVTADVERLREVASTHLPIERFEREHASLQERWQGQYGELQLKLGAEERVTVAQTTRDALTTQISQNNRWLVGIVVANGLTLIALVLHLAKVY